VGVVVGQQIIVNNWY